MGTLGKAFGVSGAYAAGSQEVIDLLVNRARSFVFTTAPTVPVVAAARAALELVASDEGERRRRALWERVSRLRAGLVIGALVVASGIAGAAIDRALIMRRTPTRASGPRLPDGGEQHRRTAMLDRMATDLSLTAAQRAGLDSIFRRTDSSLRAIQRETRPRIQQVFAQSKAEVNARLDPAQREKFAKMRPPGRPSRDGYRGGGGRGKSGDSSHQ